MTKNKSMKNHLHQLCILLTLISLASLSHAQVIKVAVASNFLSTANILKPLFEADMAKKDIYGNKVSGQSHTLQIISGSTGQLSHQILSGAPFDVFLSANKTHARMVKEQLNISDDQFFKYAQGSLVLVTSKPLSTLPNIKSSLKQVLGTERPAQTISQELKANIIKQVLTSANKVAIANAKTAPYGRATEELLSHLKLTDLIKNKTVKGQNIAQTYQFFISGSADAAFVAHSHWLQANKNKRYSAQGSINIPINLHSPIEQWGLVVNNTPASRAFQNFLMQPHIQTILKKNGYGTDH
jgi:molybdate transport system substrate-binding protein